MASEAGDNEKKVDRALSQRWVDFKRTALRYEDGDEIYEEFGDDDYYDNNELQVPPVPSIYRDQGQHHIPGGWDANSAHEPNAADLSVDVDVRESRASASGTENTYDASATAVPSKTSPLLDSEPAVSTPVTYAAVQNTLGPTITAREAPKPLNINVAIAQQAPSASTSTSLDSSIPSSVAGHEYSGLNRFSGLLLHENSDEHQLDEVAVSKDESKDVENSDEPVDVPSGLRIANLTEHDYVDSPAAESDDVYDEQSARLDRDEVQRQSHNLPTVAVTADYDTTDESIQRNIGKLSLSGPVDSSASTSEASSIADRTDKGAQPSYVAYSDRKSSYASTRDSAYLPQEETAYNTTTDSDDYIKLHDRSTSVGTTRSESEIMTDSLLEQLEAQQALEARRQSAIHNSSPSPAFQKQQIEESGPGLPSEYGLTSTVPDRPPIPVTVPTVIPEPEQMQTPTYEEPARDERQLSLTSTIESDGTAAEETEEYFEPSVEAEEIVTEKLPEPYVPAISYLSAPYPGPRWNFSEILKEPNPIKRKILFEAARKMEQRYDSGLDQWLLYMTHQRDDVQPFATGAVAADSLRGHHTIQRTTSMIGHSVTRYSERSVEMMERVGEKSKGIFHKSKLFGSKMTREDERATTISACSSAQSKTSNLASFSTSSTHPVFKDSYLAMIRRNKNVSVYMVTSIDYISAVVDSQGVSNSNGATESHAADSSENFSRHWPPIAPRILSGDLDLDCHDGSPTDGDLSTLEATTPEAVPESTFHAESQKTNDTSDNCIADLEYDVNAILSAYEDSMDSSKTQPFNSITTYSPSKAGTQPIQRHKSLRDFEPSLFTLPKVRSASSARIAAMRAASVTKSADKDTSALASSQTFTSGMTQRRVVTTPALPEPNVDLKRMDSVTKSFLSKELAIFDDIGNFNKERPTSSFSVDYAAPKSMLLPDADVPSPRLTNPGVKPLPHGPLIASEEPVVIPPKNIPSFEVGIPRVGQRSDGMAARLKGLSKLKLPGSSPKPKTEAFNRQPAAERVDVSLASKKQIVTEKGLPSLPPQNTAVSAVNAAPRNYAKRKPVAGIGQTTAAMAMESTVSDKTQRDNRPIGSPTAPPLQRVPQPYIVKPLPMEPGQAHVPKQIDFRTSEQRAPKPEAKAQPIREFNRKPTDFKSKFKDLMQMDAMGITPATRTQAKEATATLRHNGSSSLKDVKINLRTLKGKIQKRAEEQEATSAGEYNDERDMIANAEERNERTGHVHQQQRYEEVTSTPRTVVNEPTPPRQVTQIRAAVELDCEDAITGKAAKREESDEERYLQESNISDLSSQPTDITASSPNPVIESVHSHSNIEREPVVATEPVLHSKSASTATSLSAAESLRDLVLSYGTGVSEEVVDIPLHIGEETEDSAVTLVAGQESMSELSAGSSTLSLRGTSQGDHEATLLESDLTHDEGQPDIELVDNNKLAAGSGIAAGDGEPESVVHVSPISSTQEELTASNSRAKYRRRRSSMPEWSPIVTMLKPAPHVPRLNVDVGTENSEHDKKAASHPVDSPELDLLGGSLMGRHHKSKSDPELAWSEGTSSKTISAKFDDKPQIIRRSEFERQQTAKTGESSTKIVYVVPDDYGLADQPVYLRAMSPTLQMEAPYRPSGRMMVDPRYRPPPRPGLRPPPPGYMRRPPQQRSPQGRPPMHRPTRQVPPGQWPSQRLRPAHMMDSDNVIPIFDSDRVMSRRPLETFAPRGMMPPRDYSGGGYRSRTPDRMYGPSDDYRAQTPHYRPGYTTPPPASSASITSRSSGGARSQSSSGGFNQGSSAATAKEHMLRMATTPDFDGGAIGSPKRFPKRRI
ncbi:hypothetical protein POJ06DRAFT_212863 [Lipomyces tetrasporus]|uniref:Uncharacterized protein n=1 Tax=Lipomyces tetrasporus TaxID=54092 RepID=A0AAD7QP84_9ASCO|nr:uncharacterized protein POJ06DRAFT_212863 [Lipomyces tetrasporus]KAJ8098700.1 hypothetical protein POJ06DRAFT_212863 [Lipomyces tetrasporus]